MNPSKKADHFVEFAVAILVLLLLGWGVWFALKYVRHEREEGSATHQLRRIDEEAIKGGWVKASNGVWSLPENPNTNRTISDGK